MQNKHTSADLLPGLNIVTYADALKKQRPPNSVINF